MDSREAFEKVYAQNFEKNGPTWEEDYEFALWSWDEALKWQASCQSLDSCMPVAYDMGDEIYGENSGDINDYIRQNGRPLVYADTSPASAAPNAEYIRALQDAFNIIQADANTEENYGSLCRIGSVLVKLKAKQEKTNA